MVLRTDGQPGIAASGQGLSTLLDTQLAELYAAADRLDAPAIKRKLREIVPEYLPQDTASVL